MRNNNTKRQTLLDETTPFAIREAFNNLRSNIMYTAKESDISPAYAVTSSDAGVGKSTVIANLAISFSQLGKKVLLIDGDMRRPTQAKTFGCDKKQKGLSELLSRIVTDDNEVICNPYPDLYLLTSGCIPPNPSELISSQTFKDYIKKWRCEYDVVFVDLPPVKVVADPLSIATSVDGFIMVAMAHKTNANRIKAAIAAIEHVNGRIIGLVLNRTELKGGGYGKREYGYYYYTSNIEK